MKVNKRGIYQLFAFGLNMTMIYGICENILLLSGYGGGSLPFVYLTNANKLAHILFLVCISFFLLLSIHKAYFFIIAIGWGCFLLASLYLAPEIESIFFKCLFYTVRNVIIVMFAFMEITDFRELEKNLIPYIYVGAVYSITQIKVFELINGYSMNYSYSSIIAGILCMLLAFRQKKIKFFLLTILFISTNFLCGARGALICYFISGILYVMMCFRQKRRLFLSVLLGALTIFLSIFFEDLFKWVYKLVPNSRTVRLFAEGKAFSLSSRNIYYTVVIDAIRRSPFKINGLYSDRCYIGNYFGRKEASEILGSYTHNVVLEILFQFGVWGIPIILICILLVGYAVSRLRKRRNFYQITIFIVFFSYCFGRLLFSGSYLTELAFGGVAGIIISLFIREGKINQCGE